MACRTIIMIESYPMPISSVHLPLGWHGHRCVCDASLVPHWSVAASLGPCFGTPSRCGARVQVAGSQSQHDPPTGSLGRGGRVR